MKVHPLSKLWFQLPTCTPTPGPLLFVGNHSGAGALDFPLLVHELHLRGYCARALVHPAAWFSPLGPSLERFGGVKANPYAAYRLLKQSVGMRNRLSRLVDTI